MPCNVHIHRRAWSLLAFGATASALHAHGPISHQGESGPYWQWNFEPHITLNLLLLAGVYALGLMRLWRSAGWGKVVPLWRAAAFAAGVVTCVLALLSPIDLLSAQLSSVHMIQHMLLMNLAAPLLVLGSPLLVMLWALPSARRKVWAGRMQRFNAWPLRSYAFWQPLLLWTLYALVLWVWHVPRFYQAALRNELVHDLQHLLFLLSACLFWRVLLDSLSRFRLSQGAGVVYLFTTSLHATVLGVFMALAPSVWYPDYEPLTGAFNLTALEDQQLAGLIMWMPACAIYAIVAAISFGLWLRHSEQAHSRRTVENSA